MLHCDSRVGILYHVYRETINLSRDDLNKVHVIVNIINTYAFEFSEYFPREKYSNYNYLLF